MSTFDYRDDVAPGNVLPAMGAGLAVGAAVGYLVNILLRRRPLPPGGDGVRVSSGPPRVPILPAEPRTPRP